MPFFDGVFKALLHTKIKISGQGGKNIEPLRADNVK
jgi:hypothetical protein